MRCRIFGLICVCLTSVNWLPGDASRIRRQSSADYDFNEPNEVDMPKPQFAASAHFPAIPPSSGTASGENSALGEEADSDEIVFKVGRNIIPYSRFKKELLKKQKKHDSKVKLAQLQVVDGSSQHEAVLNTLMVAPLDADTGPKRTGGALTVTVKPPQLKSSTTTTTTPTAALTTSTPRKTTQSARKNSVPRKTIAPSMTTRAITIIRPNVPVPIKIRKIKFRPVAERFRSPTVTLPKPSSTQSPPSIVAIPLGNAVVEQEPPVSSEQMFSAPPAPSSTPSPETPSTSKPAEPASASTETLTSTPPVSGPPPVSSSTETPETTTPKVNELKPVKKLQEHIFTSLPEKLFVGRNYVPKALYQKQERLAKKKLEEEANEKLMKVKAKEEQIDAEFQKAPTNASDLPLRPDNAINALVDLSEKIVPEPSKSSDHFVANERLLQRTTKTLTTRHTTVFQPTSTPQPQTSSKPRSSTARPTDNIQTKSTQSSFSQLLSLTPTSRHPITQFPVGNPTLPKLRSQQRRSRINYLNFTPAPRKPSGKVNRFHRTGRHFISPKTGQLVRAHFVASVRRLVAHLKQH